MLSMKTLIQALQACGVLLSCVYVVNAFEGPAGWSDWGEWNWRGWQDCIENKCSSGQWIRTRYCSINENCPGESTETSFVAGPSSTAQEQREYKGDLTKHNDNAKQRIRCGEDDEIAVSCQCWERSEQKYTTACDGYVLLNNNECEVAKCATAHRVMPAIRCMSRSSIVVQKVFSNWAKDKKDTTVECPDGFYLGSCGFQYGWSQKVRQKPIPTADGRGCILKASCGEGQGCQIHAVCLKNVCDPNPCSNGGTCDGTSGSAICKCKNGYVGDTCQTDVCDPNPCLNGGTCDRTSGSAVCKCKPGYGEKTCGLYSLGPTDIDDYGISGPKNSGYNSYLFEDLKSECPAGRLTKIKFYRSKVVKKNSRFIILEKNERQNTEYTVERSVVIGGGSVGPVTINCDKEIGINSILGLLLKPDEDLFISTEKCSGREEGCTRVRRFQSNFKYNKLHRHQERSTISYGEEYYRFYIRFDIQCE